MMHPGQLCIVKQKSPTWTEDNKFAGYVFVNDVVVIIDVPQSAVCDVAEVLSCLGVCWVRRNTLEKVR